MIYEVPFSSQNHSVLQKKKLLLLVQNCSAGRTNSIRGPVVGPRWVRAPGCDRHGSKLTQAFPLCPWERHFPRSVVLASSYQVVRV